MSLNSEAEVTEILIDGVSIPLKSITVYDGLDSTNTEYCLSANQGKVLNEKIDTTLTSANTYTDNKIAELVGEAPDTLNTLDELSEALKDNKDVVTILEEAIANKVDKVEGKVLSTNDYTTEEKEKLASLENYDDTKVKLLINGKVNQETLTNYYTKDEINSNYVTNTTFNAALNNKKYLHKIELTLINSNTTSTASI
jgi:methyl coenzyme M reductase beta subunit